MKKVSQIVVGLLFALLFSTSPSYAATQPDCSIIGTGPGSSNECIVETDIDCEISNENEIDFENDNPQNAGSGDVDQTGNTTGGSAQSGDASNQSGTEVIVDINNGTGVGECGCDDCGGIGGGGPGPTKPETPETPRPSGGIGGGFFQPTGAQAPQVEVPAGGVGAGAGGTSGISPLSLAGLSLAAGIVGLTRLRNRSSEE